MSYREYLDLAKKCAQRGGKIIREGFLKTKNIEYKGFGNPVTQFDKASEKAIVGMIHSRFPEHSILTEEDLSADRKSEVTWVIDPLDGTVNFTHHIPFVCVSIGIEVSGKIVAGAIYNPILDELYEAEAGKGAFLNRKPIHVSGISDPEKTLMVTGFSYEKGERLQKLMDTYHTLEQNFLGVRRLGSAAMDIAYVARGNFEVFYEEDIKPWDVAAGIVLVQEAGGKITNFRGEDYNIHKKNFLFTNGLVHEKLVKVLKEL